MGKGPKECFADSHITGLAVLTEFISNHAQTFSPEGLLRTGKSKILSNTAFTSATLFQQRHVDAHVHQDSVVSVQDVDFSS